MVYERLNYFLEVCTYHRLDQASTPNKGNTRKDLEFPLSSAFFTEFQAAPPLLNSMGGNEYRHGEKVNF